MTIPFSRIALCSALCLVLAGCASAPKPTIVQPLVPPSGTGFYHTLEKGQTVYRVAKTYGVTVDELLRANRISDPNHLEIGTPLWVPKTPPAVRPAFTGGVGYEEARHLIRVSRKGAWRTVTLHHSATRQGSAGSFHRDHTRRRMGGLFYHFVIGNGSGSGDGEIEVGFRWARQVKANRPMDVQICLVGDFSRTEPTSAQMESLISLVRAIRDEYGIPVSAVRRHEDIKGKHTECPGRHFPFHRVLSEVSDS
ncbi:MAG: hypothetical protein MOGMAGMI_00466 [Candidatus Omnitrophica bacterium]|nr:hypothetical protein [Candidatus Omnitrophota bacterium]